MAKLRSSNFVLWLLSSTILLLSVGCNSNSPTDLSNEITTPNIVTSAQSTPAPSPAPVEVEKQDYYQLAIEQAAKATTMSQAAQSRDDWKLIANRWQRAVNSLKSVPSTDAKSAQSQKKRAEYQRNLAYALRQANQLTIEPKAMITVSPSSSTETKVVTKSDVTPSSVAVAEVKTNACKQLAQEYEAVQSKHSQLLSLISTLSDDALDLFGELRASTRVDLAKTELESSRIKSQYQQQCL